MASDSLGTMTVGVTANVSDAERALNSLANMLEKFDRQQQTRARSAGSGGRGAGAGGGGYFSPMSEEFNAEIRRMEMVQKRTESTLRFRQIRQSEMAAVSGRGTEENMRAIGEAFKSGDIERLEGVLGRANRGLQQVGDTSARTRYAVLNLGYGIQDAVTVFGTSGLAGAVRASANNLQGLGIIFERTAGGMQGLKAALMSGEFVIMGVATAVLLAANAWEQYTRSQEEALAKQAKERFKGMQPERAVDEAVREGVFKRELARIENLTEAEKKREEAVEALAKANDGLNASAKEEASIKATITKIQKQIADFDEARAATRAARPAGVNVQPAPAAMTAEQLRAVRIMEEAGGRAKALADLAEAQKKLSDLMEGPKAPGQFIKDKEEAQRQLQEATNRVNELQPNEISNAIQKLKTLEAQAEALDEQIGKQSALNKQTKDGFDISKKELDTVLSGMRKTEAMFAEIRKKTTSLGTPKGIRDKPEYQLTPEEREAAEKHGFLYPTNLADMVSQQRLVLEQGQKTADGLRAQREKLGKDIELLNEKYPMIAKQEDEAGVYTAKGRARLMEQERREAERQQKIDARQAEKDRKEAERDEKIQRLAARRNLREFESDMEYRLAFLGKKRREIEQRMRIGNQPTGVAEFESSTAYEALARSRMQQSPAMDILQTIAKEEQKATAALEDIREKLDPGRRARIAILETLE